MWITLYMVKIESNIQSKLLIPAFCQSTKQQIAFVVFLYQQTLRKLIYTFYKKTL